MSLEILKRGVVDLISEENLKEKLERGIPLRIKLGADPTRPDLHLGHAVILRKMRQFQDLGHKVIMLIGDFTAMIGDPSGKNKTRPPLSLEQARANAQSYLDQCKLILRQESEVLEIRWNSEWLETMGFKEVIELTAKYTVARILERDDFSKRLKAGVSISVHEMLYPLAQAFDSVALEADVELGGTDQLFNLLVGRDIQREYGQEAQVVMTLPLLVGLDGVEKMSKSLDNYIGLTDSPEVMYAKLMKVPDTLLSNYFTLLTDLPEDDIALILAGHPVTAHRILATLITSFVQNSEVNKPNLSTLKVLMNEVYNAIFGLKYGVSGRDLTDTLTQKVDEAVDLLGKIGRIIEISRLFGLNGEDEERVKTYIDSALPNLALFSHDLKNALVMDNAEVLKRLNEIEGVVGSLKPTLDDLAREVVRELQASLDPSKTSATLLLEAFSSVQNAQQRYQSVAGGGIPDDLPEFEVPEGEFLEGKISISKLAVWGKLASSNGEAKKLIQNRGLKLDGVTVEDPMTMVSLEGSVVLQKGKDKFARLTREN